MNKYNDIWTREKFLEYRKLKRSGYSHQMLKDHFGEDIYESGMYNKNAKTIYFPWLYKDFDKTKVNEIIITPELPEYTFIKQPSLFIANEGDYIISFISNNVIYIIALIYYPINNVKTYNIVFTTNEQWKEYSLKVHNFIKKGYITIDEEEELNNIISKETKLNDLFSIMKKITGILFDFHSKHLSTELLSIGDTNNEKKINLYRNIIKVSFDNVKESEDIVDGHKYFIYEIS